MCPSHSPTAVRKNQRGLPFQSSTVGIYETHNVGEHRRCIRVADLLAQPAARLYLRAVRLRGHTSEFLENLLQFAVVVGGLAERSTRNTIVEVARKISAIYRESRRNRGKQDVTNEQPQIHSKAGLKILIHSRGEEKEGQTTPNEQTASIPI